MGSDFETAVHRWKHVYEESRRLRALHEGTVDILRRAVPIRSPDELTELEQTVALICSQLGSSSTIVQEILDEIRKLKERSGLLPETPSVVVA